LGGYQRHHGQQNEQGKADNVAPEVFCPMRCILLVVLVPCLVCVAQNVPNPPETPEQQLDKLLGRHVAPDPSELNLKECQDEMWQWSAWAKTDNALYSELRNNYDQLYAENQSLQGVKYRRDEEIGIQTLLTLAAVGFGAFMAWGVVKAIRRWWPSSKQRRQLITLLLMATWVTVAAVVALSDSRLSYHPVNLAFSVLVYSLPALAFGGVGVWWFGRTKPEILW
jgi:hypothetical protein